MNILDVKSNIRCDFQKDYMQGAEYFMNWNVQNNYGNYLYKIKTEQLPKSLFKLFSE